MTTHGKHTVHPASTGCAAMAPDTAPTAGSSCKVSPLASVVAQMLPAALQSPRSSSSGGSSESGSTCSGDSDEELGAQLAEEGLAPDSEALLTSNLLGPRLQLDMTIGGLLACDHCV